MFRSSARDAHLKLAYRRVMIPMSGGILLNVDAPGLVREALHESFLHAVELESPLVEVLFIVHSKGPVIKEPGVRRVRARRATEAS